MINRLVFKLERYDSVGVDYTFNEVTLIIGDEIEISIPIEEARQLSERIEAIVHDGTFKQEEMKRLQAEARIVELEEKLEYYEESQEA